MAKPGIFSIGHSVAASLNGECDMQIVRSTIAGEDILRVLVENYRGCHRDGQCMLEYRGVNDIYQYTHDGASFYLKIYARKDVDENAIAAEVEIVNYLRQTGVSVAYPIATLDGRYLLPFDVPEGMRYGVLFSEAAGRPFDNDALGDQDTIAIGSLLAKMHATLDTMPAPPRRWKLDEQLFLDQSMEILERHSRVNRQDEIPFLQEVAREIKQQIRANSENWKWGLCHGDVYTGNIHHNRHGDLTIFDFDFCGVGWRAYDVASFLGIFSAGIRPEVIDRRKRRLESFLHGYQGPGAFSDSEVEAVYKVFVPFRRIFNLGYLYDSLVNVWGNRLRKEQISNDLRLLRDWIDYYW
jgi:Ser/Thr protein kinase RdoA (MazF antagonist)